MAPRVLVTPRGPATTEQPVKEAQVMTVTTVPFGPLPMQGPSHLVNSGVRIAGYAAQGVHYLHGLRGLICQASATRRKQDGRFQQQLATLKKVGW
jgi:hypothetical protein